MGGVDLEVALGAIADALDTVSPPWTAWGVVLEHQGDELRVVPMLRAEMVAMLRTAPSGATEIADPYADLVERHTEDIPVLLLPRDERAVRLVFVTSKAPQGAKAST